MAPMPRFLLSMHRRRTTLLAGCSLILLSFVALHYAQRGGAPSVGLGSSVDQGGAVRFLKPTPEEAWNKDTMSVEPPTAVRMLRSELEQPSRDEIGRRRHAAGNNQDHDSWEKELYRMGVPFVPELNKVVPYVPAQRLVHLDLKGAPPKVAYLKKMFALFRRLGATGVLMEYEDMVPFTGKLKPISAGNAYSTEEIQEILQSAKINELKVIPLVQTFGHLEFALKTKAWSHLREVPESPQALCPSLNESLAFVEELLAQVMDLHVGYGEVTHLHIGCDEVLQMGECVRCRSVLRDDLFLNHVRAVAGIVRRRWPTVTPIIWDDMLRHVSQQTLEASGLRQLGIEPMVWVYAEDVYRFVNTETWEKYAAVFPSAWGASAFKGAHGETLVVPPARKHLENTMRWLAVMDNEKQHFKNGLEGVVLTGWQRYDHFAVLCELLPAAIPTLALCLAVTSRGKFDRHVQDMVTTSLSCPEPTWTDRHPWIDLNGDPSLFSSFNRCLFPGHPFFRLTQRLESAIAEANLFLEQTTITRAWLTEYNTRRNYSVPFRVDELMQDFSRVLASLKAVARGATSTMEEAYDGYTIAEWVEQRVYPTITQLDNLERNVKNLKAIRHWAPRPLPYLPELKKIGVPPPQNMLPPTQD